MKPSQTLLKKKQQKIMKRQKHSFVTHSMKEALPWYQFCNKVLQKKRKKITSQHSPDIDAKILNNIPANWIQLCIKKNIYHRHAAFIPSSVCNVKVPQQNKDGHMNCTIISSCVAICKRYSKKKNTQIARWSLHQCNSNIWKIHH